LYSGRDVSEARNCQASMSREIDILPIADSIEETMQRSDRIEGVAGELSPLAGKVAL
jgi:hypothetical protein